MTGTDAGTGAEVIATVLARGLAFPEGPVVAADGAVWCVELAGGSVTRRAADGTLHRVRTGGRPNGLAEHPADGSLWFCDAGRDAVRRLDPGTHHLDVVAGEVGGRRLDHPNDLAFDPVTNLVFTCPGDSRAHPTGYVCCLDADGAVTVVRDGMRFPNGLALTPDGEDLVVAETYRQRLWRGRWDRVGRRWLDPQVWVEHLDGPPGPDGMAFAADGTLYVAVYGSGAVAVVDPDGHVVDRLPTPGAHPTNVALEPHRSTLLVTEAQRGELLRLPTTSSRTG